MSTIKTNTLSTLDGVYNVPSETLARGACRAWVNFNGTGTVAIRESFNVSSITDNGTGDYTVNFATALVDANYAVALGCLSVTATQGTQTATIKGTLASGASNKTASAVQIITTPSSAAGTNDSADINVTIFR
jgi:hypothetical protein